MRYVICLLLGLTLTMPAVAREQYLELRANARLYEKPDRDSAVVAELKVKERGRAALLRLVSNRRENGYYRVAATDSTGKQGWIYKSYVRLHQQAPADGSTGADRDSATGGPATARVTGAFEPACDLPFPVSAVRREISDSCGIEGSGRGGKALSVANRLQNRAKNNLCARGSVVDLDFKDFVRLQKVVDEDLGIEYGHKPPDDRTTLKKVIKVGGTDIGEGSLVRYVGYVHHPRNSNVSKGESVNCNKGGVSNNDIHVDLLRRPDEHVCSSVTVEIIPHFRPKLYSVAYIKELPERPFRFTGQLFFDGAHKPCKTLTGPGGNPKRATVWEIHPVYSIDVCKYRDIRKCKTTDESAWLPMQDAINEVHEEDDD